MGVTIHYQGRAASAAEVARILSAAVEYAREQGWSSSWRDGGVVLSPHPLSEPIELKFFGTDLSPSYVKTQFAGPDVHVAVAGMFRQLLPCFHELLIDDEGRFWETGSREDLLAALKEVDQLLLAALGERDTSGPYRLPSGRIVDVLTGPAPECVTSLPFRPRQLPGA